MLRVLLVDDEPVLLRATAAALRSQGDEVTAVEGGGAALEAVQPDAFDVALVDLMMPRMTGLELVRRLHDRAPSLPVVLMSSFPLAGGQRERLGVGPLPFVPKGLAPPALHAALVAVLDRPVPDEP